MLTKSEWFSLSEKAQWDIKVALRGPDSCYGETLKWFTTSVIRGQCADVFRVGGLVNPDLKLVVLPYGTPGSKVNSAFREAGKVSWNYEHFVDHVSSAAVHLGLDRLHIEADLWHSAMQGNSAAETGSAILSAAKDWEDKWGSTAAGDLTEKEQLKLMKLGVMNPGKLYAAKGIAELTRHLTKGVRF